MQWSPVLCLQSHGAWYLFRAQSKNSTLAFIHLPDIKDASKWLRVHHFWCLQERPIQKEDSWLGTLCGTCQCWAIRPSPYGRHSVIGPVTPTVAVFILWHALSVLKIPKVPMNPTRMEPAGWKNLLSQKDQVGQVRSPRFSILKIQHPFYYCPWAAKWGYHFC